MEIPEAKGNMESTNALIVVMEGEASEKLDKELKHLVNTKWDFGVKKIDRAEYIAVFSDKNSLETLMKLTSLEMQIFGLKVKISKSSMDPTASSRLQVTWIKIFNVPDAAREVKIIKELASLAAEPIAVDELSLIKDVAVRVKVQCRDPAEISGYVEVFFNGVGYELKYVAEGFQNRIQGAGAPPMQGLGDPDNNQDKKPDKSHDSVGRKKMDKFSRIGGNFEKEQESSHEDSQGDNVEEEEPVKDGSPKGGNEQGEIVRPVEMYHLGMGMMKMMDQRGSEVQTPLGVGSTQMNEGSSRSHFVLTLRIFGVNEGMGQQVQGVLNLIDLAGTESVNKSGAVNDQLKETQAINLSLSCLTDVFLKIAKKEEYVPFRNSKLTCLLQPCLGRDSKVLMFVNLSPEVSSTWESISLRIAARVNSCELRMPRRQTRFGSTKSTAPPSPAPPPAPVLRVPPPMSLSFPTPTPPPPLSRHPPLPSRATPGRRILTL